jgi:hypothetical protein
MSLNRDLLRVQGPAAGLDVVLELLAALAGSVQIAHGDGPDAPRDRPITAYSGSIPFEKKNERFCAKSSTGMPRDR